MALAPGTRLGPYEIDAQIGAGGMGEVYRATDGNLGRHVAIKILPDTFAHDPERLARFEREAKTLASLNHPNIAIIHGFEKTNGVRALVMEFVKGETLADRIARGPIPIDEALLIARQIAEALDAAHDQGIVHRDLKPPNVMVRPDGVVKVLDFGLAKAMEPSLATSASTASPTTASPLTTVTGRILGTVAYMSPEQARGTPVDKRADIWAFGCVVFEMLSGRAAFARPTLTDTVAAVIEADPPWAALQQGVPPSTYALLQWCLEKDPRRRLRDIGDASRVLEKPDRLTATASTQPRGSEAALRGVAVAAVVAAVIATAVAVWSVTRGQSDVPPERVRFAIGLRPDEQLLLDSSQGSAVAISRDGRLIVYATRGRRGSRLYVRRPDLVEPTEITGTDGATDPFISPDGAWVGFVSAGSLKKVPMNGGAPQTITAVARLYGASWADDDSIVYGQSRAGLFKVQASGGTPTRLTTVADQNGEIEHMVPHVLPGGRAALFAVRRKDTVVIDVLDLRRGERKSLLEGSNPQYTSTGYLVFTRGTTVYTALFDARSLAVAGPVVASSEQVQVDGQNVADFAIATDGTCVFVPVSRVQGRLVWRDGTGAATVVVDETSAYTHPRLSPDGNRVVVQTRTEAGGNEFWIYELNRGTRIRLNASGTRPIWTPDGKNVIYSQLGRLYSIPADDSRKPQLLLAPDAPGASLFPLAWWREGILVYSRASPETNRDVYTWRNGESPKAVVASHRDERAAMLSPDGHWIVYAALEPGRDEQIYVQRYPDASQRTVVSQGGGREPAWSPTGDKIFYRSSDGRGMLAVVVQTEPSLRVGPPRTLFEGHFREGNFWSDYDVTPDGKRFLMVELVTPPQPRINVVQGWISALTAQ
jgi:Tol biopolymer transport system component